MYIKAVSAADDVANYTIVSCHDPSSTASGAHCCSGTCANFYPLQTCGSICGVVVMVMAAIACHNPVYFSYLSTRHNQDFPSVFLQTPSRFSKYLRLVIASWIAENSVNTSYIIQLQDEITMDDAGGKEKKTYCMSKSCTESADIAQKLHVDTKDKNSFSLVRKSSEAKTESKIQPKTEEISKDCNASRGDKNHDYNSSQSCKPEKESKFQPRSTKEKKFQCRHCDSSFTTSFSFRRHMQSRHPTATAELDGKSECNNCGFKCHRIGDLRTHLSQKHNVIFSTESITLNNINGKSIIIIKFIHLFFII